MPFIIPKENKLNTKRILFVNSNMNSIIALWTKPKDELTMGQRKDRMVISIIAWYIIGFFVLTLGATYFFGPVGGYVMLGLIVLYWIYQKATHKGFQPITNTKLVFRPTTNNYQ